jgi:hypothetical protein
MERHIVMRRDDTSPKIIQISANSSPNMNMISLQVNFSQNKKAMITYIDNGVVTLFWEDGNWEIMKAEKFMREFTVVYPCGWSGYSPVMEDVVEFLNIQKQ